MAQFIILTALPFGKKGNQSLLRFVTMLLDQGHSVKLVHGGQVSKGERVLINDSFSLHHVLSLRDRVYSLIGFVWRLKDFGRARASESKNVFLTISSEKDLPPFGEHTLVTSANKWSYFCLNLVDNVLLVGYLTLVRFSWMNKADVIVGYECNYAFAARFLATVFGKKYINKYQGVTLHATKRDFSSCKKYYPLNYYGINKSDLCLMVNDGTDGEYYASERGCKNIHFSPHGVNEQEYSTVRTGRGTLEKFYQMNEGKLIIANVASGSRWKRVDRIIRALSKLEQKYRLKLVVATTYFGPDRAQLREFANMAGVEDCFCFLDGLDHLDCNELIRSADALLMTNDLSNLGNPVLEALYYGTPVLTIDDGSCREYLDDFSISILIDRANFDSELRGFLRYYAEQPDLLRAEKKTVKSTRVNSLVAQQCVEYSKIEKLIRS